MGAAKRREFCQSEVHCSGSATSTPVGGAAAGGGRGGLPKPAISPRRRAAAHEWGGRSEGVERAQAPAPARTNTNGTPHTPIQSRNQPRIACRMPPRPPEIAKAIEPLLDPRFPGGLAAQTERGHRAMDGGYSANKVQQPHVEIDHQGQTTKV